MCEAKNKRVVLSKKKIYIYIVFVQQETYFGYVLNVTIIDADYITKKFRGNVLIPFINKYIFKIVC